MKQLSGYCIACTGMGYFRFYKLTLKFKSQDTKGGSILPAKCKPGVRILPITAALIDHSLDYFFQRVSQ